MCIEPEGQMHYSQTSVFNDKSALVCLKNKNIAVRGNTKIFLSWPCSHVSPFLSNSYGICECVTDHRVENKDIWAWFPGRMRFRQEAIVYVTMFWDLWPQSQALKVFRTQSSAQFVFEQHCRHTVQKNWKCDMCWKCQLWKVSEMWEELMKNQPTLLAVITMSNSGGKVLLRAVQNLKNIYLDKDEFPNLQKSVY